jgi:hypothetical protein
VVSTGRKCRDRPDVRERAARDASGMTFRRTLSLVAALPVATVLLASCAGSPAPASAPVAPAKDTAAACSAVVSLNAVAPPGTDPDDPAPSAAELQAWAASVATPFATLRDNAPDQLRDSVAAVGGLLDQARAGQRIDATDEKASAATNDVEAWVHSSCGFQTLDIASNGGKLGPAAAALKPGPVSIKFSSSGEPSAFVMLLARVKDGQQADAADVDTGRADFEKVAEVVGAAQPTGPQPAYATANLQPGHYLLTSPLGQPPNIAGTSSLDLTVS